MILEFIITKFVKTGVTLYYVNVYFLTKECVEFTTEQFLFSIIQLQTFSLLYFICGVTPS